MSARSTNDMMVSDALEIIVIDINDWGMELLRAHALNIERRVQWRLVE